MTRSIRYKIVNDILYELRQPRMHTEELDAFEEANPNFDSLSDDWSLDFGPNRVDAIREWRAKQSGRRPSIDG
jgi:hypothetical protein